MISLLTISEAQDKLRKAARIMRINQGLTQECLANRAGVALASLRKFEQKGLISLEALLKILMTLGKLEEVINSLEHEEREFESIDKILEASKHKIRKYGRRK